MYTYNVLLTCCFSIGTTHDITKKIKRLEETFADLHRRLQSELTEGNGVSTDDFLHSLSMLPVAFRNEYTNSIHELLPSTEMYSQKVNVRLFLHFAPLFVFIDYGLLEHLITKFGSMMLKKDMNVYVAEMKVFMKETTVADVIDLLPGHEILHLSYAKVKAKIGDDPKSCTLQRLNEIRRKVFSKIRLSEFVSWVISMESSGSFVVYWLIPAVIVPDVMVAAGNIDERFCQDQNIQSLSLIEGSHTMSCSSTKVKRRWRE